MSPSAHVPLTEGVHGHQVSTLLQGHFGEAESLSQEDSFLGLGHVQAFADAAGGQNNAVAVMQEGAHCSLTHGSQPHPIPYLTKEWNPEPTTKQCGGISGSGERNSGDLLKGRLA